MRCERDDAILGLGWKMEVFKTATKTDQTLLFLLYSSKHLKLIGVVTVCLSVSLLPGLVASYARFITEVQLN